jgi:hypothetical protein
VAEIETLKARLASVSDNIISTGHHTSIVAHQGDALSLQELQFAKEATETKYNRLKAEFQDVQAERRRVVDAVRASSLGPLLAESANVDLPQLITVLCDRIASTELSSVSSVDVDKTRNSLAKTEAEKVELQRQINLIRKHDSQKAQLLEEKDRHLKSLQVENLDLIQSLKAARKERDVLKTQKNTMAKHAYMDGLVPSSASKDDKGKLPSLSHGRSPMRSSAVKATSRTPGNSATTEKENSGNARNPTTVRSSTKQGRTPGTAAVKNGLPQKKPEHSKDMNAAFAPADDPTGDCKQS